jgi:hypothetical protein
MEGLLQAPSATAFDAVAAIVSLIVYLGVAFIMVARWRAESHARVFLVVALTSAVPYLLTALQWWKGSGVYTPATIMLMAAAFCIGSTALFHFTQIFPSRRPWIRAHGAWLIAAYIVPVLPVALVAWILGSLMTQLQADMSGLEGSGGLGAVSSGIAEPLVLLGGLPVIFLVGVVLPFCGVMSLFKSWQETKKAGDEPARVTTFWMVISQLAGGVLAVLVLPLLHLAGVPLTWATAFAGLAYVFALVMPIAYFMSGARDRDAPASTPQLHNSSTPN